jgi:hypothetical protein
LKDGVIDMVEYNFDFLNSIADANQAAMGYGNDYDSIVSDNASLDVGDSGVSNFDLNNIADENQASMGYGYDYDTIADSSQSGLGGQSLWQQLAGMGGNAADKLEAFAKSNPRIAEGLLNTGGGLLAALVKQSDTEKQIKAAKEIRATDNQYQKDAEERQMRRAAHAAVKKENWSKGTGLLDAAMQQKGAK